MPKKGTRVVLKDGRSATIQKNITRTTILVAFSDGRTETVARTDIAEEIRRTCEMCGETDAVPNERYCKECKKAKLKELKERGYLQAAPPPPILRSTCGGTQKENTHETKHSVDDFRIMPEPKDDF